MARSTVPGYFAVATDLSFVSVAPVTWLPSCGAPAAPAPAPAGAVCALWLPVAPAEEALLLVMALAPRTSATTAAPAATSFITVEQAPRRARAGCGASV